MPNNNYIIQIPQINKWLMWTFLQCFFFKKNAISNSESLLLSILYEKMNWEDHINSAITKANKKMRLMWKLNSRLFTLATSYIPQLEYGSVI